MSRTADSLVEAVFADTGLTNGATCDFGVDTVDIYRAYQLKVRSGEVTADQLHEAATGDNPGEALTALIGVKIDTVWDGLAQAIHYVESVNAEGEA